MKPTLYTVLLLSILGASLSAEAQTIYPITANVSTSSFGSGVICTNCIIQISPGVTVTIDNTCGCNTCTFVGGTVVIANTSNFSLTGVDSFNNMQVIINKSFNQSGNISFYGDTVALNASMNFSNGRTDFDSSRISVNADLTVNKGTIYKDSLHLNANLSFSNAADSFAYSNITVATGKTINTNTSNFINSTFAFQGSSSMSVNNGMTSTGSNYYLAGTATISSSATTLSGDKIVMNGTTNGFTTTVALSTTNTTVLMNSSTSSSFTGNSLTASGGSITGSAGAQVNITNAANLTNTPISISGTNAKFTANSLTASGGTITAGVNSTVNITNAINLTNTPVSLTTATFSGGATAISGGSFASVGSNDTFASLTTSNMAFGASGSAITTTNAINMTNTTVLFNGGNFRGNSLTTSGGSITATGTAFSSTNAISLSNTTSSLSGGTLMGNSLTVTGGSLGLNNTNTTSTNAVTFDGATATISGTTSLTGNSATVKNGSTLTLKGTATATITNALTLDHSDMYLNGTDSVAAGSMAVTNGSWLRIGDGTLANTAHVNIVNGFSVDNASNLGVANNNNYLYIPGGPAALKTNTISCNGGGSQHSCATGFVYGCGTISNNAGLSCIILATADMNLTASAAGAGQTALTFTDVETTTADRYLIQRNSGDNQWNTINTLAAGGYTAGEYRYTDADAPASSIEYRVERIDQTGKISYSPIATVTIEQTAGAISIHPNPAIGGMFYLTTANTGETMVNIYTLTGQLLMHASLNGQNQYAIHLPVQTQSLSAVVVQTIGQAGTHSFTVLVR